MPATRRPIRKAQIAKLVQASARATRRARRRRACTPKPTTCSVPAPAVGKARFDYTRHRSALARGRGRRRSGERHRARAVPARPGKAEAMLQSGGRQELSARAVRSRDQSAGRRAARRDDRERRSDPRAAQAGGTHDPESQAGSRELHGARLRRPSGRCAHCARLRHRRRTRRRADRVPVDGAHAVGRTHVAARNCWPGSISAIG